VLGSKKLDVVGFYPYSVGAVTSWLQLPEIRTSMTKPLTCALWIAICTNLYSQDLQIQAPDNDSIALNPTVNLQGSAVVLQAANNQVTVTVNNGASQTANIQNGQWSLDITLQFGHNRIEARFGQLEKAIAVTRPPAAIGPRPQQKVFFRWTLGVDDELKQIAEGTLNQQMSPEEIVQFVNKVKTRTLEVFEERYAGVANVVVVSTMMNNAHQIVMLPDEDDLFGQSPFDCGSLIPLQQGEVHVGTYRSSMVDQFAQWRPMSKNDSWETRAEDVAQCLGRTAAHEMGHSLGLVGEPGGPCGWMNGCDGGHSCDDFDANHPEIRRFDSGWFIMDPGGKSLNLARLSEPNPNARTIPRTPPAFNLFNRAYFRIVHP
jgi:hypothetical protein